MYRKEPLTLSILHYNDGCFADSGVVTDDLMLHDDLVLFDQSTATDLPRPQLTCSSIMPLAPDMFMLRPPVILA
jgi:hypothetical protein